jgi:hypothetical protein
MKRSLAIVSSALISLASVVQSAGGINSTVILNQVAITPSLNEGEVATLSGNIGDLALSQTDRFLNQLFVDLLGRSIEPAELDSNNQLLTTGTTRSQLATTLLNTSEHRIFFATTVFTRYLGRVPDSTALVPLLTALAQGATQEQVVATVIGSAEYFQKNGSNNSQFFTAVYRDLLGRQIDLTSLSALDSLISAGKTRTEVAAQVLASADYRQVYVSNTFVALLRHEGAASAVSAWVGALGQGTRAEVFIASLAGSDDYFTSVPKSSYRLTVDWGDGTSETVDAVPPAVQNIFFPFKVPHRYLDNQPKGGTPAPINVSVTLHASTGMATGVAQLFVKNVGPALRNVTITSPAGVGIPTTLSGDILDPGAKDVLTLLIDWGDGKNPETVTLAAGATSFKTTHTYTVGGSLSPAVTVSDDDGALANQQLKLTVTTFNQPGSIPSTPALAAAADTGVAPNDAITKATTGYQFTGTSRPGNRIDVFANGQLIGFNNADNAGNWFVNSGTTLTEGTYQVTAQATDISGITTIPSQPLIMVVDVTPPFPCAAPDLAAGSDTGASNTDNITAALVRTYVGVSEPGGLVELFLGTNVVGVANVDSTGHWVIEEGRLGSGTYQLTARAQDRAGNIAGFSPALTVTIAGGLVAPSAPVLAPESDLGLSATDRVTSQQKPVFSGTSEANALIQILANDTPVGTGKADASGNWKLAVTTALSGGNYSITAKSLDAAGNTSAPSPAIQITVDTTTPASPSAPDLSPTSDNGTSDSDNVTSVSTPTFTGTAEAGARVELFANGTLVGSAIATGTVWTIPINGRLADGTYLMTAQATDVAGNRSALSTPLTVTIKTPETRLNMTRVQNTLLLSWPASISGFVLQSSDDLNSHQWQAVDKLPTIEGDAKLVILTLGTANKYYRLIKQ